MLQENNPLQPRPDRDRTIVDFAEDNPAYLGWHAHLSMLAEVTPDVFLPPPIESTINMLAVLLADKNYYGAYFMGGSFLMHMIMAELEEQEMYEECNQIKQTLEDFGPSTEPFHTILRKKKEDGNLA